MSETEQKPSQEASAAEESTTTATEQRTTSTSTAIATTTTEADFSTPCQDAVGELASSFDEDASKNASACSSVTEMAAAYDPIIEQVAQPLNGLVVALSVCLSSETYELPGCSDLPPPGHDPNLATFTACTGFKNAVLAVVVQGDPAVDEFLSTASDTASDSDVPAEIRDSAAKMVGVEPASGGEAWQDALAEVLLGCHLAGGRI